MRKFSWSRKCSRFFCGTIHCKRTIFIKQNELAKEIKNARPSRFTRGDKIDAMIIELNKSKKIATLSIKALEEKQTEEAVKKYGSKDSGGVLGEILGPLIKKKSKK